MLEQPLSLTAALEENRILKQELWSLQTSLESVLNPAPSSLTRQGPQTDSGSHPTSLRAPR